MCSKSIAVGAVIAAVSFLVASFPVEAQERARTRITIQKRSYLDAGTIVKPGTARYHDYAFPLQSRFPSYGPFSEGSIQGSRLPLLRMLEGHAGF